jgi:hypothetical protein
MNKLTSIEQDMWLWLQEHDIAWKQIDQKLTAVLGCLARGIQHWSRR